MELDPLLADAPEEETLAALVSSPLCRIEPGGVLTPVLVQRFDHPSPQELQVTLRPNLQTSAGAFAAADAVQALLRPLSSRWPSPYRALLTPLRTGDKGPIATSAATFSVPLAYPWPDLEVSLCHPALSPVPGIGPFVAKSAGSFVANLGDPEGRPFVDRLSLRSTDARGASRLFALDQADLVLGRIAARPQSAVEPAATAALYSTYLVFKPERTGPGFKEAFEGAIDVADLTRYFVAPPAVAQTALLPPSLMAQPMSARPVKPVASGNKALTLSFDAGRPDQRQVAERVQVRLHDLGFVLRLEPLARGALRERWASGDFDLILFAVLLPPSPAPALAVVLDLAGRRDLLRRELPGLGREPDAARRAELVRARAQALLPELPLIPLYAQGLHQVLSPKLLGTAQDGQGLARLDELFFSPR